MSRLPSINPRDLRDHADQARIDRIWGRVRRDLPAAAGGGVSGSGGGRPLARRPARSVLLWAAAMGGVFGVGLLVGSSQLQLSTSDDPEVAAVDLPLSDVFAAGTRQRTFALPGGGRLVLQPESLVEVVEVRDGNVRLHLLRGRASLDASTADMSFAVVAGEATTVAPAGSVVSLSRLDTDVDVAVDRGSVEVLSPSGRRVINGGEASRVPIVATVSSTDDSPHPPVVAHQRAPHSSGPDATAVDPNRSPSDAAATDGEPVAAVAPPQPEAAPSWFALWDKDKLDDAARVLEERGGISSAITAAQSVRELMALYEIAAMKGRHDLANAALRRVADEFPSDPNGAVAANTLANTYERMGKADLAAKYRAQAMQSQRLSETLLCSQLSGAPRDTVEARRKAKALALEYLQRFADGTCLDDAKAAIEDAAGDPPADPPKDGKSAAPPAGSSSGAPSDGDKSPAKDGEKSGDKPSGGDKSGEKGAEKAPAEKAPDSAPPK